MKNYSKPGHPLARLLEGCWSCWRVTPGGIAKNESRTIEARGTPRRVMLYGIGILQQGKEVDNAQV
jgi:hypothetical protein